MQAAGKEEMTMRDFWDPPSADLVNVALVDTIMELLGNEALCPDDILALVRSRIPGISLDRVLITLYENSALFHRQAWPLVPRGPRGSPAPCVVPGAQSFRVTLQQRAAPTAAPNVS
jgi:hypothetical protein